MLEQNRNVILYIYLFNIIKEYHAQQGTDEEGNNYNENLIFAANVNDLISKPIIDFIVEHKLYWNWNYPQVDLLIIAVRIEILLIKYIKSKFLILLSHSVNILS